VYRLDARKDDLLTGIVLVTAREARGPVVLALSRGMTLVVRVLDGDAPIQGAQVAHGQVADAEVVTTTDEQGVAFVRGLGAHFQRVDITARGFASASISLLLAYDPGAIVERTVKLTRGTTMRGVVLAPDDTPMTDARVQLVGSSWGGEARTDSTGAWRFDCIPIERYRAWALSAYGPSPAMSVAVYASVYAYRQDTPTEAWTASIEESGAFVLERLPEIT